MPNARRLVHALRDRQSVRLSGSEIMQINIFVAFHVCGESYVLSIRRKLASANFPLVLGEPFDLPRSEYPVQFAFRAEVEQSDVVVTIRGVRGDEDLPAVGNRTGINIIG